MLPQEPDEAIELDDAQALLAETIANSVRFWASQIASTRPSREPKLERRSVDTGLRRDLFDGGLAERPVREQIATFHSSSSGGGLRQPRSETQRCMAYARVSREFGGRGEDRRLAGRRSAP